MNSLYQLIQSLSSTEKKFFKLYAVKYDISHQKHELLLFEAIVKTPNPTDEKVKKRIESKQVLKQFALYKHLLYKNLLTYLADNPAVKSSEEEIIKLLKRARVLYSKAMYKESVRFLDKAISLAQEHELFALHIHLCEVRHIVESNQTDLERYHRDNVEGIIDWMRVIEQQKNLIAHRELNNRINHQIMLWGVVDSSHIKKSFSRDISAGLKRLKDVILSKRALLLYWQSRLSAAYANHNYASARRYLLKTVRELQKIPANYPERTEWLFKIYYLLLWSYFFRGEYEKAAEVYKKANALPMKAPHSSLLKFDLYINYEVLTKLHTGKGCATDELEKKLMETYSSYLGSLEIQNRSEIELNLAALFFIEGKFNKSMEWLQHVFKYYDRRKNFEVFARARILQVIIQYAMRITKLLKYSILSAKRFIRKKRPLTMEESLLLSAVLRQPARNGENGNEALDKCFSDWARGKPVRNALEKLLSKGDGKV